MPRLATSSLTYANLDAHFEPDEETPGQPADIVLPEGERIPGNQPLATMDIESMSTAVQQAVALRCRFQYLIKRGLKGSPKERLTLFSYVNSAGASVPFPMEAALRTALSKTCTIPLIDFLMSPGSQGFRPKSFPEYLPDGTKIRKRCLTVEEGRLLFGKGKGEEMQRKALWSSLEKGNFHYIWVPFVRPYHEPSVSQKKVRSDFDHCYFVVICGLAPGVPLRLVWTDPMWAKPTEDSDAEGDDDGDKLISINYKRSTNAELPSHHLYTAAIRTQLISMMKSNNPKKWANLSNDDIPRHFLEIDCYGDHGIGIAMCMAGAKLMARPYYYLSPTQAARADNKVIGTDRHPQMQDLFDCDDSPAFTRLGQATLLALYRLIEAAERKTVDRDHPSVKRQSDFDWDNLWLPRIPEHDSNRYVYPKMYMRSWTAYKQLEAEKRLDMVYYAIYKDRLHYDAETDRFR